MGSNGNKSPFAFLLQEEKHSSIKNVLLLLCFLFLSPFITFSFPPSLTLSFPPSLTAFHSFLVPFLCGRPKGQQAAWGIFYQYLNFQAFLPTNAASTGFFLCFQDLSCSCCFSVCCFSSMIPNVQVVPSRKLANVWFFKAGSVTSYCMFLSHHIKLQKL